MLKYYNFNLKKYNAYRLSSVCAKAIFPENEEEIIQIYRNNPDKKIILLGNGNNIILSKEYYDALFIILNNCFDRVEINGTEIIAQSGCTMLHLSELALENSLSGFEVFYDIPSSVGGAVFMNAGASGEEIKNLVVKVRYFDLDDFQIKEITRVEIGFEYRNSFFQKNNNKLVLKTWFKLSEGKPEIIKAKMDDIKQKRWAKQPREFPNCGSVFKRPSERFVGPMIDELGLKGFTIGGAQISQKHSGFIVNINNATGKDILSIIKKVQKQVKKKYGVDLEVEQRII
ncbi:MAG: UDP-N-acetylenolpyruvoylglucosamine reductase [Bacteroidetes bacterium 4484_249]|nr:MAG: UDP-N-acetylenolpyruvoylglucosamine reductase [Bacteroidetes bacterium 4484_249]